MTVKMTPSTYMFLLCKSYCSNHFAYMIYLNGSYYYYLLLTDKESESRMFKRLAQVCTAGKRQMEDSRPGRLAREMPPPRYQMPL